MSALKLTLAFAMERCVESQFACFVAPLHLLRACLSGMLVWLGKRVSERVNDFEALVR